MIDKAIKKITEEMMKMNDPLAQLIEEHLTEKCTTEGIRRNARKDDFEEGDLMILPADSQKKLSVESAALNHCVKTYGDKIARGKCWIWFVRKKEDPDKPYYTMETDTDGHMIQCRGDHNRDMTDEVKRFAAQFEAYLQAELKKERATA